MSCEKPLSFEELRELRSRDLLSYRASEEIQRQEKKLEGYRWFAKAWKRAAKTYRKVIDQHDERSSSHLEDKWFQMERDKLKSRLHEAENLIHAIAEWTDDEKLEAQCLQFLDGEI